MILKVYYKSDSVYEDNKLHLGLFALHKLHCFVGLRNLRGEGAHLQIKTVWEGLQPKHLLEMIQLWNGC